MIAEGKVRIGVVHGSVAYVWLVVIIVSIIEICTEIYLCFHFLQCVFEEHRCLLAINFLQKSFSHLLTRPGSADIEQPGV